VFNNSYVHQTDVLAVASRFFFRGASSALRF